MEIQALVDSEEVTQYVVTLEIDADIDDPEAAFEELVTELHCSGSADWQAVRTLDTVSTTLRRVLSVTIDGDEMPVPGEWALNVAVEPFGKNGGDV